ncbi:hypothetical protein AB3R30_16090 [Leptolyngbyaceae cyanobacterium UHCC 1019]
MNNQIHWLVPGDRPVVDFAALAPDKNNHTKLNGECDRSSVETMTE